MPDATAIPDLTVAIPTFKRVDRLVRLLPVVAEHLRACVEEGLVSDGRIIVVDNDPERSAESACADVHYVAQPTPGIPAVRNAALDAADTRLLAFIDDDETPRSDWLGAIVRTWLGHGRPTGVTGRVVSQFPEGTAQWVLDSGLFQRPERPTGTRVPVVATGNLLLDLHAVRAFGVRFDESIGLGGGSDTMFSTTLSRLGATFVWCNESVADDPVEASRLTREWALRRAFSHGNVAARVAMSQHEAGASRLFTRLRLIAGGSARVAGGSVRVVLARLRSRPVARNERMVRRGAGMISGAMGRSFFAYAHDRAAGAAATKTATATGDAGL